MQRHPPHHRIYSVARRMAPAVGAMDTPGCKLPFYNSRNQIGRAVGPHVAPKMLTLMKMCSQACPESHVRRQPFTATLPFSPGFPIVSQSFARADSFADGIGFRKLLLTLLTSPARHPPSLLSHYCWPPSLPSHAHLSVRASIAHPCP